MIVIAGDRVSAGAGAVPRGQAAVRGGQQAGHYHYHHHHHHYHYHYYHYHCWQVYLDRNVIFVMDGAGVWVPTSLNSLIDSAN